MRVSVTWLNDAEPHQIRLFTNGGANNKTFVSCTCRRKETKFREPSYEPMGSIGSAESPWLLYDNPENHKVNKGIEFKRGDRTKQEMFLIG